MPGIQDDRQARDGGCAHLDLQTGLEADAVWDGGLELSNGIILFFHLGRDGRLRQVETSRLGGYTQD
jgi:hypothetical protein